MQNFKTLRQSLLGELAMSPEEEKKMPFIVATYVYASSQQRTHSARTKINEWMNAGCSQLGTLCVAP
jgi:hypothetical protein